MKVLSETRHNFHSVIIQIQNAIDLEDRSFAELLEVSPSTLGQIKRGKGTYRLENIYLLCEKLELSVAQLLKGEIDFEALDRQFHGNPFIFPEKYLNQKQLLGRARAVLGLFDYLDTYYGMECARSIRKRMQIRSAAFSDPMLPISPLILIDALREAREMGLSDSQVRMTGTHNLLINRNTLLGKTLAAKPDASDLYRAIHEELRGYYDQLFEYKILKLQPNSCLIRVQLKEETQDLFSTRILGNRQVCLYKQGVYISFIGNIREPLAEINESECMYHGAKSCVYQVSW